ncbi:MAG: hypothetical protein WCL04_01560 [Verrucomicrobiota bacterium]
MRKVFLFHGLKRSGNHAVINWLTAAAPFFFFNNVVPMDEILSGRTSFPPQIPLRKWLAVHGYHPLWNPLRTWGKGRPFLLSLEDHTICYRPFSGLPADTYNLLILRDPYNLFASRIRKAGWLDNPCYARETGALFERPIILWKEHAREFLGDTAHLENKVPIYFNSWFGSEAYRRHICGRLKMPHSDAGLSRVTEYGGGSSFDRTAYDHKAGQMNVLNRVASLEAKEHALIRVILADQEIAELHQRLQAQAASQLSEADLAANFTLRAG